MKQVLKTIESLILNSKYQLGILLAGFVMLISSCQKDELQGSLQKQELQANSQKQDLLNSFQKQNKDKKTVPFKANFTATPVVIQAPAPGTPLIILSTGTGEASHMGKTTFEARITIDVFGPQPNLSPATFTLTAANGDQIFMNSIGIVSPPDANGVTMVTLTNTITGGTGRFADATGTLTGGVIRGATTDTISLEGRISY